MSIRTIIALKYFIPSIIRVIARAWYQYKRKLDSGADVRCLALMIGTRVFSTPEERLSAIKSKRLEQCSGIDVTHGSTSQTYTAVWDVNESGWSKRDNA